jgi:hypothetical protein
MKNITTYRGIAAPLICLSLLLSSCQKDDTDNPAPVNPGELITTVHLVLTDTVSGAIDTVSFNDPDGPGGSPPVVDSMIVDAGTVYQLKLVLFDESKNPPFNVSEEIEEEGDRHLFVFTSGPAQVTTLDSDVNGNPIGLINSLVANSAGRGSFRVELRHYDSAALKNANSQSYETDIEIDFGLRVN